MPSLRISNFKAWKAFSTQTSFECGVFESFSSLQRLNEKKTRRSANHKPVESHRLRFIELFTIRPMVLMVQLLVYGTSLSTTSMRSFSPLHLLILDTQKCFSYRTSESENFEQPINYTLHFIQESHLSPNGHELLFGVIFRVERGLVRGFFCRERVAKHENKLIERSCTLNL